MHAGHCWSRFRGTATLLVLAAVAVLPFVESLAYPFVYDDIFLISKNDSVHAAAESFEGTLSLFGQEYWHGVNPGSALLKTEGQSLYRPLALAMWALCYHIGMPEPVTVWPFHALGLGCHLLVVMLLFALLRRLGASWVPALAAAALFAIHPVHAEAVVYVAGLPDLLATLYVLAGLLLFLWPCKCSGWRHHIVSIAPAACLMIGLLAKESAVLLPPLIVLADVAMASSHRVNPGETARRINRPLVYGSLAVAVVSHLVLRAAVLGSLLPQAGGVSLLDNPLMFEGFPVRVWNGLRLIALQFLLFIWPSGLSIDYSFDAIPIVLSPWHPGVAGAALLTVSCLWLGIRQLGERRLVGWGLLAFIGSAAFSANILAPIGTIFGERLAYLPSIGLCVALAGVFEDLGSGRLRKAFMVALLLCLTCLGAVSRTRAHDYASTQRLFESAQEVVPRSARVHYQLGSVYARDGLLSSAEQQFVEALRILPAFAQAAVGLGDVFVCQRNFPKALRVFDSILSSVPHTRAPGPDTLRSVVLEKCAATRSLQGDIEGACADLEELAAIDAGAALTAHCHIGELLLGHKLADAAIAVLKHGLALERNHAEMAFLLARASMEAGKDLEYENALTLIEASSEKKAQALALRAELNYRRALEQDDSDLLAQAMTLFDQATQLNPKLTSPFLYRGRKLVREGRYDEAIAQFDQVLDRLPNDGEVLLDKAMTLLQASRLADALTTARRLDSVAASIGGCLILADVHGQLGNEEGMVATYERITSFGKDPVEVIRNRAVALRLQSRPEDALRVLLQGLCLEQENHGVAPLRREMVPALLAANRFDEALATLDDLEAEAQEAPDSLSSGTKYLQLYRVDALMGLDRDREAWSTLDSFERGLSAGSPDRLSVALRRAQLCLHRQGPYYDPEQASRISEAFLDDDSTGFPVFHECKIRALTAQRDYAGAQEYASKAAEKFPRLGRFQQAEAALRVALENSASEASRMLVDQRTDQFIQELATMLGE